MRAESEYVLCCVPEIFSVCARFPKIFVCPSLTEIDIQGNEIGHDGALAIAHAISEAPSLALKKLTVPNGMEKKEHLKAACEARGVTLV